MTRGVRELLARPGLALLALALGGCFSPELGECLACRAGQACPAGQRCVGNVCVTPGVSPSVCAVGQAGAGGGSMAADADSPSPSTFLAPAGPVDGVDTSRGCPSSSALKLTVSRTALGVCTGRPFNVELSVEGGSPPYRWFMPELVPGITLAHDGSSPIAQLTGAFTEPDMRSIQVAVESGGEQCASTSLSVALDVRQTPRITSSPPLPCAGQQDYRARLEATGGDPGSYQWSSSGLPAGLRLVGDTIHSDGLGPGAFTAPVEFELSLQDDDRCPAQATVTWSADAQTTCFGIEPRELPAPCAGLAYSTRLSATSSAADLRWEALSNVPGLTFDAGSATLAGVTDVGGTFSVRLSGEDGRIAERSYDLGLRERCSLAYVSQDAAVARLHVNDVFGSADNVLPEDLALGEQAADFKFAPNGQWIAFRAGPPERYRLYLRALPRAGSLAGRGAPSSAVTFDCPADALAGCGVLDYAWSRDSAALAVVLSGTGDVQDYLSGITLANPPIAWPLLGAESLLSFPFMYRGELRWVTEDQVALVAYDAYATGGQQVPAIAQVAPGGGSFNSLIEVFPAAAGELGLLPVSGGVVALRGESNGMLLSKLSTETPEFDPIPASSDAAHGPWLSPSGRFIAKTTDQAELQIFDMDQVLRNQSAPNVCGSVIAWTAIDAGRERLACAALSPGRAVQSSDMALVDYRLASDELSFAFVPEIVPAPLQGTRRALSASGSWLGFVSENELRLVDAASPAPELWSEHVNVSPPVDLQFAGDERLLVQHGDVLSLVELTPPSRRRVIAGVGSGPRLAPADPCQESYHLSPQRWCGAARIPSRFSWSGDGRTILFEDVEGDLWVSDLGEGASPRRVTRDLAQCPAPPRHAWATPCAKTYAFQP